MSDIELLTGFESVASSCFDGHITIMRFTTNWRVGFGTPASRCDIDRMWSGKTFQEAALAALHALRDGTQPDCQSHKWLLQDSHLKDCPFFHERLDVNA